MNIALDYDGTCTEDAITWIKFCVLMNGAGHKVYIVTMRYPSELADIPVQFKHLCHGIIATSRKAKRPACEALGLTIHVWIDDNPRAVNEDAEAIWGWSSDEGNVITTNAQEK